MRGGEALDPADVERAVNKAGQAGGAAFDALAPKNRLTRKFIERAPFNPKKPFSSMQQPFSDADFTATAKTKAVNTQRGIASAGQKAYDTAIKGLSPTDEQALYKAMDSGTVATLSPEMQARAATIKKAYDSILHLEGARTVRKDLATAGFTLPDEMKAVRYVRARHLRAAECAARLSPARAAVRGARHC